MFENLIKDAEKLETPKKTSIDISQYPAINSDLFRQKIRVIDTISDNEIFGVIKGSLDNIVNDVLSHTDVDYIDIFINARFLNILSQVMANTKITYDYKLCCNKLAYDYLTLKHSDPVVKQCFYNLASIVNRDIIPLILALGIPNTTAMNLAIARSSSAKEIINVKRVNFVITTSSKDLMTEQTIVYIYEKLFDRMTPLFEGTMFDVYNEDEEWVTDDIMEIYSTISIAVLYMLDRMTTPSIRKVLVDYSGMFTTMYSGNPHCYRFSLLSLSRDYDRVRTVAEALKVEGYVIP